MRRILPLLVIFTVVLVLYNQTLSVYFSQDDFFMFKVSQSDGTLKGFLNLLTPHPFEERGIAFYRPFFREALHNIYYSLFGLNHYPFRILMFLVHFTNITLVYILVKKVFNQRFLAFFTAFFFGITSAHVSTLYYLAGGIEAGGATAFALTTLIVYNKYLKQDKRIYLSFSFLTFLMAIFSHEIVITLVGVMMIMVIFLSNKKILFSFLNLLPFFLTTAVLIYIDLFVIGLSPGEKQYQAVFSPKSILNSFVWYSNWALGLPETLIDFVGPGINLNPTLMRYWSNFYLFIFPAFTMAIAGLTTFFLLLILKAKKIFNNKRFLFFMLWFPISLTPVIFLPFHKSTHYLIFALPAFWLIISFIIINFYQQFKKRYPKTILGIVILTTLSLVILSVTSIRLGDSNYWAASRGRLAQKLIYKVKSTYPALPKGAVIYFKNDPNYPFLTKEWGGTSKQASLVLNGNDALQLLYQDFTLKVFYEDLVGNPVNMSEKIYTIVAKIN